MLGFTHQRELLLDDLSHSFAVMRQVQRDADASQINDIVVDVLEGLVLLFLVAFDELRFELARSLGTEGHGSLDTSLLQDVGKLVADFLGDALKVLKLMLIDFHESVNQRKPLVSSRRHVDLLNLRSVERYSNLNVAVGQRVPSNETVKAPSLQSFPHLRYVHKISRIFAVVVAVLLDVLVRDAKLFYHLHE